VTDSANNTEEFTYDSSNNMTTITDRRGNIKVTNTYDLSDRLETQTYADSTTSSFDYTLDVNGAVTQTDFTDQRGSVKRIQFNADGYPTSITSALGLPEEQTWTFSRNNATNHIESIEDALGRITTYDYDALGNVTGITKLSGTLNAVTTVLEFSSTSFAGTL
jgi:YD repeat-containing protein